MDGQWLLTTRLLKTSEESAPRNSWHFQEPPLPLSATKMRFTRHRAFQNKWLKRCRVKNPASQTKGCKASTLWHIPTLSIMIILHSFWYRIDINLQHLGSKQLKVVFTPSAQDFKQRLCSILQLRGYDPPNWQGFHQYFVVKQSPAACLGSPSDMRYPIWYPARTMAMDQNNHDYHKLGLVMLTRAGILI